MIFWHECEVYALLIAISAETGFSYCDNSQQFPMLIDIHSHLAHHKRLPSIASSLILPPIDF